MLCCQWLTEHHSTGHTTSTLNEKGADIEPSGLDLTLALADNARNQRLPMRPLVAPPSVEPAGKTRMMAIMP
jgi:hypothetical protein